MADSAISRTSPATLCQAAFVLLGAGIISLTLLPAATQKHLLDYGARDTKSQSPNRDSKTEPEPGVLERFVAAAVARLQVPHAWFISFYAFYLAATVFWAVQWWLWRPEKNNTGGNNSLFKRIVTSQSLALEMSGPEPTRAPSMDIVQVYATFGLEALQASRRLYEYLYVLKQSKSKMNFAHFALGWVYYAIMSVAVWVEGSQAIMASKEYYLSHSTTASTSTAQYEAWVKLAVGVPLFLMAWAGQYRCHAHLASLKKYSLPEEGLFRYLTSPHYTCEFFLYMALSIIAAPEGRVFNRTILSSEVFVLAGLGVTANRTKQWYSDKFGTERVAGKWKMIPFIF